MALSISDIAKAAGVSTTTVSRVINGSPKLKPETREKVKRVMEEMNYSPNFLARGLSNSKILNIALLIDVRRDDYFNPFFYEVMHGIEKTIMDEGYCLIISSTTPENKFEILNKMIIEKRIGGVLIPSTLVDGKIVDELIGREFPFVVIGGLEDSSFSCSSVDVNNMQGGLLACRHLYENGYKKIAFISGDMDHFFNRKRLEGYKKAIETFGKSFDSSMVLTCDGSKNNAYEKMKRLLAADREIDAVVCGDNIISFGVMKAVNEAGKNIPRDMGIVTFDNYPLAEILEPRLTSINIDVLQLGALAADTLLNNIAAPNAPARQSLIATTLECRDSSMRMSGE